MLKLVEIKCSNQGRNVCYNYSYNKELAKYFNPKGTFYCHYDIDVSDVPESIMVIPFLANFAPIAWFAGFSIEVNEADKDFIKALEIIKKEFIRDYKDVDFRSSEIVSKLVENTGDSKRTAMLFSGGVDAYATYFRHYQEDMDLVTIHGADIEVEDEDQWNRVIDLNEKEDLLKVNRKFYVRSNLRTFYTHRVDLLVPSLSWWGSVQHGLALTALLAPISFKRGYEHIYIASTYTSEIDIAWGSKPEIDNNIRWAYTNVIHDGYELKRQDKLELIVNSVAELNKTVDLRVCYSLLNENVNCSNCEKCYRTMIGLVLENSNPEHYGFIASQKLYDEILAKFKNGFSTKGFQYFWWEIYEKINSTNTFYVFFDKEKEEEKLEQIRCLIRKNLDSEIEEKSKVTLMKFRLQNTFPRMFRIYVKLRNRKL